MVKRYNKFYVTKGPLGNEQEVWGDYDSFERAVSHAIGATFEGPYYITAYDVKKDTWVDVCKITNTGDIKRASDLQW